MTAGVQKIWHPDARVGFLAQARALEARQPALEQALADASASADTGRLAAAEAALRANRMLQFNNRLDAVTAGVFLALVCVVQLLSVREWLWLLARRKLAVLHETAPVWLPDYAVAEGKPLRVVGLLALALALARELSGEADLHRAQHATAVPPPAPATLDTRAAAARQTARPMDPQAYLAATERRFRSVRRCC